jgi:uncharacterized protein
MISGAFLFFVVTKMAIVFHQGKRQATFELRGLDFARSAEIFDAVHLTVEDNRIDYGETRYITIGWLDARMVVIVWTPRHTDQRIISMRKANEREQALYGPRLDDLRGG